MRVQIVFALSHRFTIGPTSNHVKFILTCVAFTSHPHTSESPSVTLIYPVGMVCRYVDNLKEVAKALRALPQVEYDVPTLALVGAPNVGKSSLVKILSSGTPEVSWAQNPRTPNPQVGAHAQSRTDWMQVAGTLCCVLSYCCCHTMHDIIRSNDVLLRVHTAMYVFMRRMISAMVRSEPVLLMRGSSKAWLLSRAGTGI